MDYRSAARMGDGLVPKILWSPTGRASVVVVVRCGDDERMFARLLAAVVKAKGVTVVAGGKTYKLTKSGSKWRSAKIAGIDALAGSAPGGTPIGDTRHE